MDHCYSNFTCKKLKQRFFYMSYSKISSKYMLGLVSGSSSLLYFQLCNDASLTKEVGYVEKI